MHSVFSPSRIFSGSYPWPYSTIVPTILAYSQYVWRWGSTGVFSKPLRYCFPPISPVEASRCILLLLLVVLWSRRCELSWSSSLPFLHLQQCGLHFARVITGPTLWVSNASFLYWIGHRSILSIDPSSTGLSAPLSYCLDYPVGSVFDSRYLTRICSLLWLLSPQFHPSSAALPIISNSSKEVLFLL